MAIRLHKSGIIHYGDKLDLFPRIPSYSQVQSRRIFCSFSRIATDEQIMDALHKASCDDLVNNSAHGIDTIIGESGMNLSGGEKQRISIARALLRHPRLLIFDEATSALDSITEEDITNTIRSISMSKDRISLLIAHRLSTIMHADVIYVLEQGKIVETGSHTNLLDQKGLYYAMWRQQVGERRNPVNRPRIMKILATGPNTQQQEIIQS